MPQAAARAPVVACSPVWAATPAAVLVLAALALWQAGANVPLFITLNAAATALPDRAWALVTDLGSTLSVGALLALCLYRAPQLAAAGLLSWPAGIVMVRGLKPWLANPRPAGVLAPENFHLIGPALTHNSFPSGHAATAFAFAAAVLCSLHQTNRLRWFFPLLFGAALIGLSRIAVGAHWPLDVLGGAAIGWLCGAFGAWWAQRWPFWQMPWGMVTLSIFGLMAGIARIVIDSGYAQARPAAVALGALACVAAAISLLRASRA